MGEYSTIDFACYVFPCCLLWKCAEKQEHAGNIEIGVVIHRGIRMWYLCFTYTLVDRYFDFGWIDIMIERELMNNVKGGKTYVPYHISKSV